jgi:hypothetical protein
MTYSIKINQEFQIFGIQIKFMLEIAINKTINKIPQIIHNKIPDIKPLSQPLSHSSSFGFINNMVE